MAVELGSNYQQVLSSPSHGKKQYLKTQVHNQILQNPKTVSTQLLSLCLSI